ncbi:hypothetical protein AAF712_015465 [Marasmius tenuissimus]
MQRPSELRATTPASSVSCSTYNHTEERQPLAENTGQGYDGSSNSPRESDTTLDAMAPHDPPPLCEANLTAQSPQHLKGLVIVAPDSPEFVDRRVRGAIVGNPLSRRTAVVRKPPKLKKGTREMNSKHRPRLAYETPTSDPSASGVRKKLILQPRTKPLASHNTLSKPSSDSLLLKVDPETSDTESSLSTVDIQQEVDEDTDESFAVRSIKEAEVWFRDKSPDYHRRVVQNLISDALRSEEALIDARLVSDLLQRTSGKVLSLDVLEDAFCSVAGLLDDILCDVPCALEPFAVMINGASFSREQRERIASKLEGNGGDFLDRVE